MTDERSDDLDWLYRREPSGGRATEAAGPGGVARPAASADPVTPAPGLTGAAPADSRPTAGPSQAPRPIAGNSPLGARQAPSGPRAGAPAPPRIAPAPRPSDGDGPSAPVPPTPRRRRRPARWIVAGLVVGLIAVAGFYVFTPLHAWGEVQRVANTPSGERPLEQPGTAVLLVGTDSRVGLTDAEREDIGVHEDGDSGRSDSMMIMYVPPNGETVLLSLPRDTYVEQMGKYGPQKLNAAFSLGGPEFLTSVVEDLTGLRIDGYAEIGFGGFARVVKAVDGINVCVKDRIEGEKKYETIEPGCQHLDTKQAMWFVRSRHSDPLADIGRIQRQRQFMGAIAKRILSTDTFLNPAQYWDVSHAVAKSIVAGEDTDMGAGWAMANGLRSIASGKGITLAVPLSDTNFSSPAGSTVIWDPELAPALFRQLSQGDTSNMERYQKK